MSAQPTLSSVLGVVKLLEQGGHSEASLSALLEQAMHALLPDARIMRVYQLSGDKAIIQAATTPGTDIILAESPPHREAVLLLQPVHAGGLWVTPLHNGGDVFGLLEVTVGASTNDDDMPEMMRFAGHLLAPTLQRAFAYNRGLAMRADDALTLAHAQYEASGTIFGSESPLEILRSLTNFTGNLFEQAHLGIIDPDHPTMLRVLARSHGTDAKRANENVPLSEYPAAEALVALEALTVQDVLEDEFLMDEERARLQQQGIRSLVVVPLVVNQRLTGLIHYSHPFPVTLSPARLRALRNLADQLAVVFENRGLLRATAETLEEVRTLYDINRAMLGARDPLDIISLLRTYLAYDAAAITYTVIRRGETGQIVDLTRGYTVTPTSETTGEVAFGEALGVEKLAELDEFLSRYEETLDLDADFKGDGKNPLAIMASAAQTRAYINLLIRSDNHVREVISVLFAAPRTFDERTRRLYEAVADQIAIVLQNQRLLSDSNLRAQQLQRIASFGQSVQRSLEVSDILRTMVTEAVRTVHTERMNISLHDTVLDVLRVVAQYEDGRAEVAATGGPILSMRSPFIGRVWESGEFLYVPDISTSDIRRSEESGVRSLMIAPIRGRDRLYGLVTIGSQRPNAYTEIDITVVQQMVTQLAAALENASEFAQSQRRAQNEALINEITAQLNQQMDMQRMLNVTLNELGRALGARRARIRLTPPADVSAVGQE